MSIKDMILDGGGIVLVLLTIIQFAPIKFDPWTAIASAIGRAFNADVLRELDGVKKDLAAHVKADEERNADQHRGRILRFNNELLRDIPHTKEEFIDVLADIDAYERYCESHKDYKNNRAVHAIANIGRVYDDRLHKHDFISSSSHGLEDDEGGGR